MQSRKIPVAEQENSCCKRDILLLLGSFIPYFVVKSLPKMKQKSAAANRYIARQIETRIQEALADTRIVAIVGPRQSGKTTVAQRIAAVGGRRFVSLDDDNARDLAVNDPVSFMRNYENGAVIDEIQRAPRLILALKRAVDDNPQPGRWLITGSVDLFKTAITPDSLAGRIEVIELLPLSQTESERQDASGFLRRAFAGDFPGSVETGFTDNLIGRVLTGGYPAVFLTANMRRRQARLRMYAKMLALRDLPDLLPVRKTADLANLIEYATQTSGQLVNLSRIAAGLGVDYKTVDSWLTLLERMFLIRRIGAWQRSRIKRLVKASKLHFIDSGMLAALAGLSERTLVAKRQELGRLLETFVFSEIIKALPHYDEVVRISHYRDDNKYEVDFVLETAAGGTVGLEAKAAGSVSIRDFRGLRQLAAAVGDEFACGIVLHDGQQIMRFSERMFALPFRMLWEA